MAGRGEDLLAGVYDDRGGFILSRGGASVAEKRLQEENDRLKRQLASARGIIKVVAKGDNSDGTSGNKRLRLGGAGRRDGGASRSSALSSGEEEVSSLHLATIKADRLESELEESRMLREKDRLRYEVGLQEAERDKGKLLRQVKFLSQEEEEARVDFGKKEAVFTEEISRLQAALKAERAAVVEARKENGNEGKRELEGYRTRLEREEGARRLAEEKVETLQETAKTGANEVSHLRKRRRELEAENAELSLQVVSLRRQQAGVVAPATAGGADTEEAGDSGLNPAWDTPAARELRAKIKSLEREARKREIVLQLETERRNATAQEDEMMTLKAALQRAQERLKAAITSEIDNSAIRDEKEEWSLVFARALKEDKKADSMRQRLKGLKPPGAEEGGEGAGGEGDGVADPRPTPLVALRLLLEAQEERALSVKELAALRIRYNDDHKRLVQVEHELKQEREHAESVHVRVEELEVEVDELKRRCRSAEQEVDAQKELIDSYERDNFRKPAGEGWLADHAALQSALTATKDEVRSLRKAAEGQVSALEAGRLRGRVAKAEAALGEAIAERDEAVKAAEQYGETLATLEKGEANGTGVHQCKVLHFEDNPAARAAKAHKEEIKKKIEALTEENKRLTHQLDSAGAGTMDASMSADGVPILGASRMGMRGADTPDAKKFSLRLKEMYKERINYYRQTIYLLTGYRIDLMMDPTRQMLRLRSMYAEQESDCLLFQQKDQSQGGGLELVETPLAVQHMDKIDGFLNKCDSIPAFLSSLTIELFEKQTFVPRADFHGDFETGASSSSPIAPEDDEQVFSLFESGNVEPHDPPMELSKSVLALLESFDVDPVRGFLPRVDPLRRLPQAELQPWEAMAAALPSLLAVGQARKPLEALPELPIDVLTCHRERMRALLLLSVFAHASVWGNPEQPHDTIPRGIAIPLAALAAGEGMPPLLTHTSLVLHNWHRLDPSGPVRTENLACNCHFLGGLDETWFYIATVEIEARGGGVFGALLEAQHAISEVASSARTSNASANANLADPNNNNNNNNNSNNASSIATARVVLEALAVAQAGIISMRKALSRMPVGCHPLIFYQRVRPFLSGWKANPTLPEGVLYEGVSSRKRQYYGGSAAQSTLFPALDAALEVSHSAHSSNAFLLEMRNYMPPGHRRLLEHLSDPECPSIRRFVQEYSHRADEHRACMATPTSTSPSPSTSTSAPAEPEQKNGKGQKAGTDLSGEGLKECNSAGSGIRNGSHEGATRALGAERGGGGTGKVKEGGGVPNSTADALREAYNGCLSALGDFRSTHLGIVGSYILQQQKKGQKAGEAKSREDFAGGKGTGGTPLLDFLKPLKNDSRDVLLK
eukprot:g8036.t1